MYVDTSHITRGGKTYTRHLLRESYRANGKVLHRTIANLRRFLEKNFPRYHAATGRIRISHLGKSGWRSKRRSTSCMAFLPSAILL
jgi:hypothetical protein